MVSPSRTLNLLCLRSDSSGMIKIAMLAHFLLTVTDSVAMVLRNKGHRAVFLSQTCHQSILAHPVMAMSLSGSFLSDRES